MKLFDSELKVMEVLWRDGPAAASRIAKILKEETGWNRNTTYTVIKKCVEKGAVDRQEPGFVCTPRILKEQVQKEEAGARVDKIFDGSAPQLFAALLGSGRMSRQEIDEMKKLVEEWDK